MKKLIITLSILLIAGLTPMLQAQQVVNEYAAVLGFDPCNNRVIVDDPTGFNIGDTILMIQMKGVRFDSSNTNKFGDTLAYIGAGNYEYNTINSKNGNKLGLKYKIKRTYQFAGGALVVDGKVQIVRVPYYQDYTVNVPHTCKPWDGNKGGVFAINVADTLKLNADINIDGTGFRGADPYYSPLQSCNQEDYFYPPTDNNGGTKGEGIGFLSLAKMYGRGKLVNGGGGGNDNNSGGAGGANGGVGGNGGNQLQSVVICSAPLIQDIGGIGGLALNYNPVANKLFLGGGGGAGHGNDGGQQGGGSGGGIAIISTGVLIGNNRTISANGLNGPQCSGPGVGCEDDGTGGGGGGGVIVINSTNNIEGQLKLNAKGGKGGDAYSSVSVSTAYQPGPGGGGGGGTVWLNAPAPPPVTISVAGGNNGVLPQFTNSANGAKPGGIGKSLSNFVMQHPVDTFPIPYNLAFDNLVASCDTMHFNNTTILTVPILGWLWDFGDGDTSTQKSPVHPYAHGGVYNVRLIVYDQLGCSDTLYQDVFVNALNYKISDSVLSCKTDSFHAEKVILPDYELPSAVSFEWDFGDGNTSTGNPIIHTYADGGDYIVVLTTTDSTGCIDTTQYPIYVEFVKTGFSVSDDTVCQNELISFTDTSTANSLFFAWDFGDNSIDSLKDPVHIYPNVGIYPVRHITGDITGCLDTAILNIVVDSISPVDFVSSDSLLCEGTGITLNASYIEDNAIGIDWNLGDGYTASNTNPVNHAFDTSGMYNVTATVHFRACPDIVVAKEVKIFPYPKLDLGRDTTICPNGSPIILTDNINVGNPRAKWLWNTGDSTNNIMVRHAGIYTAKVTVDGCATNDSIEVFKDCFIDIPNAFTPNNDGNNDYFLPRQLLSKSIEAFQMTIYDRWGQEVFQTNNTNGRGWDGKFNGVDQPVGVYVYLINVRFSNGTHENYTGNITLLR